jgi:acyl-CoA thioesterase FadM
MIYLKKKIRVLPDDTDAFGRLNWLAYFRYCEEGSSDQEVMVNETQGTLRICLNICLFSERSRVAPFS